MADFESKTYIVETLFIMLFFYGIS